MHERRAKQMGSRRTPRSLRAAISIVNSPHVARDRTKSQSARCFLATTATVGDALTALRLEPSRCLMDRRTGSGTISTDLVEQHLLLVLSDSALPSGAFVASSGLESIAQHGHLIDLHDFLRRSLDSVARVSLPFINDVHAATLAQDVERIRKLDELHHATLLNAAARRASIAQGSALLSLYARALAPPDRPSALVDALRAEVRRGTFDAHLSICWAVVCAVCSLSLGAQSSRRANLQLERVHSSSSYTYARCCPAPFAST